MNDPGQTRGDETIWRLDVLQVKVLGQDRLLREMVGQKANQRKVYVELRLGTLTKKTGLRAWRKGLDWNRTITFQDADPSALFEATLYTNRLLHRDERVGGISDSVESILPPSGSLDTSHIVTRVLDSCPDVQLEFRIQVITAASLPADASLALAQTENTAQGRRGSGCFGDFTDKFSGVFGTARTLGELLLPILDKVKIFTDLVSAMSEVHPFAKIAWTLLNGLYTAIRNQVARDSNLRQLLQQMKSLYDVVNKHKDQIEALKIPGINSPIKFLQLISTQTIDCCFFIRSYISPGFVKRMAKSVVSNVDARIDAYCEAFKALEEAFYKDRLLNMELTVARVLGAVRRLEIKADLSDILYSKGSALDDEDKACLEGTRVNILDIATNWAVSEPSSEDRRTVLLLVGTAGTGKSAIAHSMAQRFKKLGRLGSSFGFVRNVQERGVTYLFPTIARNMADFDEDIRQALWEAVGNDTALRTTHSLKQQFENFLQKPFEGITISGPILIVIDALDECGDSMAGQQLASLLATHSQKLPSNFRLFVTSRPEHHIISQFEHKDHIRIEHMESILYTSTSRDINLFIQSRLMKGMQTLDGIEMEHCSKLAITSQGLFQWASVACKQIANPPPGHTPLERYTEMVQSGSDVVKDQLLDYLYREVLRPLFADDDKGMDRFRAVLGVVLAAFEPLTMMAVKGLHASLNPNEGYEAKDVLKHLGSLLSGVTEMDVPIRPLHTSFRDFLTDLGRSKDFFVDITPLHQGLLLASLNSMNNELAFNICRLDSSYVMNKDIVDLSDRIQKYIPHHLPYFCRFWAHHLDATLTTGMKMFPYQRFRELLKLFADKMILFWLEVLSILGGVSPAAPALATAARVLKSDRSPTLKDTLLDCIVDIQKFVDVFAQPMSQSAPHIYISAVPFAPRGSWISKQYLPRLPRTLRVCNPPEDWPVAQGLIQHSAQIEDIAISTDGAHIAGVCRSIVISILVWDTRTGLVKYGPFETGGNVECIAFSADGAQIAYVLAENGTIGIWEIESGSIRTIGRSGFAPGSIFGLIFSPDGKRLIANSSDGAIYSWDISTRGATGTIAHQATLTPVSCDISVSSGRTLVACGHTERIIKTCQWDAVSLQLSGKPLCIQEEFHISAVGISPDGRYVAASSNNTIHLWGLPEATPIGIPVSLPSRNHVESARIIAFSHDGNQFASTGYSGVVDVWEITPTGPILKVSFSGHTGLVEGIVYSPDGRHIFSSSVDQTIRKWDAHSINTTDPVFAQSTSSVINAHSSHDGTLIASLFDDLAVRVWNGATIKAIGAPLTLLTEDEYGEAESEIVGTAMSQDGTCIMAFAQGTVWLLDLKSNKRGLQRFEPGRYSIGLHDWRSGGTFSPDGSRVYIAFGDRIHSIIADTVKETRNLSVWKEFPVIQFYGPPVISPDRTRLAILSQDTSVTVGMRILDSRTLDEVYPPIVLHSKGEMSSWCISRDFCYVAYDLFHEKHTQLTCIEGGAVRTRSPLVYLDHGVYDSLAFLPSITGIYLAHSIGSNIVIWDLASQTPIIGPLGNHRPNRRVHTMECSQDGRLLVGKYYGDGAGAGALVWDVSVSDESKLGTCVYPIASSSETAYAPPQLEEDTTLQNVTVPGTPNTKQKGDPVNMVTMTEDGWMLNPDSRYLFWAPVELRERLCLYRLKMNVTAGQEFIQFDLSQFAHGLRWSDCYSEV